MKIFNLTAQEFLADRITFIDDAVLPIHNVRFRVQRDFLLARPNGEQEAPLSIFRFSLVAEIVNIRPAAGQSQIETRIRTGQGEYYRAPEA